MGSLTAGWDSPVLDPKAAAFKRNSSLTKGEIDAYWRANKKEDEEEHSEETSKERTSGDSQEKFERSKSAPLRNIKEDFTDMETEAKPEKIKKKTGWWTRSNWAFLNETPHEEGASNTYTSQFHVASLAPSKSRGIDGVLT
ncbi:uncharacterized protein LOC133866613 [Alnus glutinosa]|uniref:uncharacterized protein LOC133866613 n=1 Tax=Alnus glutinosa TaxID=3517 RepID=UPI002D77A5B0|nr:uncharacterized protein LOC133866613 [Alnus glutinosa]